MKNVIAEKTESVNLYMGKELANVEINLPIKMESVQNATVVRVVSVNFRMEEKCVSAR